MEGMKQTRMAGEAPQVKEELKQAAEQMQASWDSKLGSQGFPSMWSDEAGVHVTEDVRRVMELVELGGNYFASLGAEEMMAGIEAKREPHQALSVSYGDD